MRKKTHSKAIDNSRITSMRGALRGRHPLRDLSYLCYNGRSLCRGCMQWRPRGSEALLMTLKLPALLLSVPALLSSMSALLSVAIPDLRSGIGGASTESEVG